MVDWPEGIPFFKLRSGYGAQPGENVLRTPMEFGPAKVRRRTTAAPSVITGSAYMTREEAQRFEAFWRDTLKDGALSFTKADGLYRRRNMQTFSEKLDEWNSVFANVSFVNSWNDALEGPVYRVETATGLTATNLIGRIQQQFDLSLGVYTWTTWSGRTADNTITLAVTSVSGSEVDGSSGSKRVIVDGSSGSATTNQLSRPVLTQKMDTGVFRVSVSFEVTATGGDVFLQRAVESVATIPASGGKFFFAGKSQLEAGSDFTQYEPVGASYPATHVTRGGGKTYRIVGVPQFAPMGIGHRVSVSMEVLP